VPGFGTKDLEGQQEIAPEKNDNTKKASQNLSISEGFLTWNSI